MPLDLLIIMLGTNDFKNRFSVSPLDSGGWMAWTQDASKDKSPSLALVFGTDREDTSNGKRKDEAIRWGNAGNDKVRDYEVAERMSHAPVEPGDSWSVRWYLVSGEFSDVRKQASRLSEKAAALQKRIADLRDDDVPYNADSALYELAERLPDDGETAAALIESLGSDDWQQRQIAGYILARWATNMDLSRNRQFLKGMVEALCGDRMPPLMSMRADRTAEASLCAHGDAAVGLLQTALHSQDLRQRTWAAFILIPRSRSF